ncbi:hypothetical protein CERSUDRAFT_71451 [Gelatoporia subvermispora B]|uniref:Protein kinase domain-containing protein n=1 Tax=Ceriporiopsis subvermispora (strain B) TaxID=914234 RepID=M2QR52_CERS8|nr:hypothetical protein CERSUDRAFT_71451 [Gelatoporia subvermispora B]
MTPADSARKIEVVDGSMDTVRTALRESVHILGMSSNIDSVKFFIASNRSMLRIGLQIDNESRLPRDSLCVPCLIELLEKIFVVPEDNNPARSRFCDTFRKLCQKSNLLPSSCVIAKEHVEFYADVGAGGFGVVRRGKLQKRDVALKETQRPRGISPDVFCKYSRHPNIVQFRGVLVVPRSVHIVYDWTPWGTMEDYLKINPAVDRVRLLLDVAIGVEYLHTHDIVHGNLQCANILVDCDGEVARVADISLATFSYESKTVTETGL